MDLEDQKLQEKEWSLCCSKSSPSGIKFVSQMTIASIILGFSLIQLAMKNDDKEIYISLISFIIGIIFPSPHLGDSEKK